jgi:hypothetical protein
VHLSSLYFNDVTMKKACLAFWLNDWDFLRDGSSPKSWTLDLDLNRCGNEEALLMPEGTGDLYYRLVSDDLYYYPLGGLDLINGELVWLSPRLCPH